MFRHIPPLDRRQVDALLLSHRGHGASVPRDTADSLVAYGLLDRTVRGLCLTDRGLLWLMTRGYVRRPRVPKQRDASRRSL